MTTRDEPGPASTEESGPLSPAKIAAAGMALGAISVDLERMWRLAGAALQPAAARDTIDSLLKPLQADIISAARSAQIDGGTWLWSAPPTLAPDKTGPAGPLLLTYQPVRSGRYETGECESENEITAAQAPRARGVSELEAVYALPSLTAGSDILGFTTLGATSEALQTIRQSIAEALVSLATARTFLDTLETVLSETPALHLAPLMRSLVDAGMDEEATREVALETQQQLFQQPFSIANDNTSVILRLFG